MEKILKWWRRENTIQVSVTKLGQDFFPISCIKTVRSEMKNSVLQLFISRMPKMCAIPQCVGLYLDTSASPSQLDETQPNRRNRNKVDLKRILLPCRTWKRKIAFVWGDFKKSFDARSQFQLFCSSFSVYQNWAANQTQAFPSVFSFYFNKISKTLEIP